jgi:hypothetical protein
VDPLANKTLKKVVQSKPKLHQLSKMHRQNSQKEKVLRGKDHLSLRKMKVSNRQHQKRKNLNSPSTYQQMQAFTIMARKSQTAVQADNSLITI